MSRFDRTEAKYIDKKIDEQVSMPVVSRVTNVVVHDDPDDLSNYECDIKFLAGSDEQKRGVPVAAPASGSILAPEPGDIVLVQFLGGDSNRPVITNALYTDQTRAPLGSEGIRRERRGNLYYEAHKDGDWMRIAQKDNDDDTGDQSNARIEVDDTGSEPVINIEAQGDVTINVSNGDAIISAENGKVKLGDQSGTYRAVARKGDAIDTTNDVISEGSDNVDAT